MQDIKAIIEVIQKRGESLKAKLSTLENDNAELQLKVNLLSQNIEDKNKEVELLNTRVEDLTVNLKEAQEGANKSSVNDEEIDFLVREIDDCINRLKQ